MSVTFPILRGFHPDPSICRVGDDFFLVTSSFEYFPGVPIFTSTDLVTWRQIGNVLDRPSQLRLHPASGGIFAPCLRHHDGRFYMITTHIDRVREGQLLVTATDPAGPWSEPVFIAGAVGIDPDLAWDDDGSCYLTWARLTGSGTEIAQAQVDPDTGDLLTEAKPLWSGTGLANPEGPHIVRRDGWWYLLIAEGGTERGHAVSIARSRRIDGPYEGGPANPILSHRSTADPVQNTGHADLVETSAADWAMVYLGVRPRGVTPGFHVNGRETFLAGVDWIDGWPVVDETRFDVPDIPTDFADDFTTAALDPQWISPDQPAARFATVIDGVGLSLAPATPDSPGLVAVRTRDEAWQAEAIVAGGDVGLVVRLDGNHGVGVTAEGDELRCWARIGGIHVPLATAHRPGGATVLSIRSTASPATAHAQGGPDVLHLGFVDDGGFVDLAQIDGRYTSTEVAGGFTGRVVGVTAGAAGGTVARFSYRGVPVV